LRIAQQLHHVLLCSQAQGFGFHNIERIRRHALLLRFFQNPSIAFGKPKLRTKLPAFSRERCYTAGWNYYSGFGQEKRIIDDFAKKISQEELVKFEAIKLYYSTKQYDKICEY